MPVYEYECSKCDIILEVQESVAEMEEATDLGLHKCLDCGGELKKIMSKNSFQLKGSCWERDNYASHVGDAIKNGGSYRE